MESKGSFTLGSKVCFSALVALQAVLPTASVLAERNLSRNSSGGAAEARLNKDCKQLEHARLEVELADEVEQIKAASGYLETTIKKVERYFRNAGVRYEVTGSSLDISPPERPEVGAKASKSVYTISGSISVSANSADGARKAFLGLSELGYRTKVSFRKWKPASCAG